MENLSDDRHCVCNSEYKCHVHRRELFAWAVQISGKKIITVTRPTQGAYVRLNYSVEEAEQLIIDIQRAIKAY